MGFLPKRFSKSIENNNHSRIIYRNGNIAELVKVAGEDRSATNGK